MPLDVVVDTNVLVHSQNPKEPRCALSCAFLEKLLGSTTKLAVDEGFSLDQAQNSSFIGYEYIKYLTFGSLAMSIIIKMASSKRIDFLPKRAPQREQKIIEQTIRNKIDRVFVGVAYNSREHLLVSHDFEDFQVEKRQFFRRMIGVNICEADDMVPIL